MDHVSADAITEELTARHTEALGDAAWAEGALARPGLPSPYLRSWLVPAVTWAPPARGRQLLEHYGRGCPTTWGDRFYASPEPVRELVQLDLRRADVPILRASLAKLLAGAARAGVAAARRWGVDTVDELLDRMPNVVALHRSAFFGCCQPMVSLGTPDQSTLAEAVRAGWSLPSLLDACLAGPVMHELAHGPERSWSGGPGSWMVHEAAAAVVNHACRDAHVMAQRPGEAVLGLRSALVLGRAMADALGEAAVWRLALTATAPEDELGSRCGRALAAVEWQQWARGTATGFMPAHEHMLARAKLFDVARCEEVSRALLQPLLDAEEVTPDVALSMPDLLAAAAAVPWTSLEAWHAPWDEVAHAQVALAATSMFQVERLQPGLAVVPADPPAGELVVDVGACALSAAPRRDDPLAQAAVWRLSPAACRRLAARGVHTIRLAGCRFEDRARLATTLQDLCDGTRDLPGELSLDVSRAPRVGKGWSKPVVVPAAPAQLHHGDPVVTLGSCFAEHIGSRLNAGLFEVHDNPFGILYDPLSIARAAEQIVGGTPLPESLCFRAHGRWHSPWHHTDFSQPDRARALAAMQAALAAAQTVRSRRHVWLWTWGTAHVWEAVDGGYVVANCHGLPSERFDDRRLTVDEIVERYDRTLASMQETSPSSQVILTVSPIRHVALGAVENQRSKGILHLAALALAERHACVTYFPAYEIVLDELRDYRWFEEDGAHVVDAAAEQVFDRFLDAHVAPSSRHVIREVRSVAAALERSPRDPLRRQTAAESLTVRLGGLPRAPALPWPTHLSTCVEHTRAAALAMLGDPTERAAELERLQQAPAVSVGTEEEISHVSPTSSAQTPSLDDLSRALRAGQYVTWDDQAAWSGEVSSTIAALVDRDPGLELLWRALACLLDKADELEDASTVLADLATPLLACIVAGVDGAEQHGRLHAQLVRHVPRGYLTMSSTVLACATRETLAALRQLLEDDIRERPSVHPTLQSLHARLETTAAGAPTDDP